MRAPSMPTSTPTTHYASSLELLQTHPGPLIVPTLVITEVVYLLGTEPEVRFVGDLADGAFTVEPVAAGDWLRIAELVAQYRDLPLGVRRRLRGDHGRTVGYP